ncbi:MAG: PLDc N-terminal domain-containing protein [Verrucomicrobiae bacterium]|nr:PLDc N-terminal domain-containing protein [Verrucomicrobiae bacterium]
MNDLPEFGFTPQFFYIQATILLAWIILAVIAIRKSVKNTFGAATPLWILLVLLVPFIGAITTIACVRSNSSDALP